MLLYPTKKYISQLRACTYVWRHKNEEEKLEVQHFTSSLLFGFLIQTPKEKCWNDWSKLQLQDAYGDQQKSLAKH